MSLRSSIVAEDTCEIQEVVEKPTKQQEPTSQQPTAQTSPLMINGIRLDGVEGMPGFVLAISCVVHFVSLWCSVRVIDM